MLNDELSLSVPARIQHTALLSQFFSFTIAAGFRPQPVGQDGRVHMQS